jgi:hypothetical protein
VDQDFCQSSQYLLSNTTKPNGSIGSDGHLDPVEFLAFYGLLGVLEDHSLGRHGYRRCVGVDI